MALRKTLCSRFLHSVKCTIRPELPKTPQRQAHLPFPIGDDLMKRIRSSFPLDRIQYPNFITQAEVEQDANRKLLRISRIDAATAKQSAIPDIFISSPDFAQIRSSDEQYLARAIESFISDPRRSELKEMEAEKAIIDGKAEAQVRRELWAGLGLAVLQTAAFMRLTFWELSWDVMEPVCFFTTSIYFMLGWAFFLRTSKEPSFEGFFAGRFAAKQRRLMKAHCFDLSRFNELGRTFLLIGSHDMCHYCHHRRSLKR